MDEMHSRIHSTNFVYRISSEPPPQKKFQK